MKTANKTCIAIFVLLITSWTTFSQSQVQLQSQNGLTTTIFSTSSGIIQVYLPNISGSQTISGTIKTIPNGDSNRKKDKNLKALKNLKINIGGVPINLQSNQFTIASSPTVLALNLEENNTQISATINLNDALNSCSETCIPSYIVAGSPAPISSVLLDGNLSNTSIVLGETQTNILAESENHAFFEVPNNFTGQENLTFSENETTKQETVNVLQLNLTAEKLNLLRSETTTLTVSISGLEGLTNDVPLTLTNNSTNNIQLQNGNNQDINIPIENDTYTFSQTVTAINNGSYSVTASIIPDQFENNETGPLLCNCLIARYSYLISPEACSELGGECAPENLGIFDRRKEQFGDAVGNFNFTFENLLSYVKDIEDLEDDIQDEWEKWDRTKHIKDSLNELYNDLVAIDKVLDHVPKAYEDKLKNAIDNLVNAKEQAPDNVSDDILDNAISNAQARLKACKNRIAELEELINQQEDELEAFEEKIDAYLKDLNEVLDDYCLDNSCLATITKNEDGTISLDYNIPKEADESTRDYISEFTTAIGNTISKHRRALKTHKQTLDNLSDAKDECAQLSEALQRAKDAKAKADNKAAAELELEEQFEQIKRILQRLKRWCEKNPDHCNFLDDIESILKNCPKTPEELENFWENFDDLITKKKNLEDELGNDANEAQNDMDDIENDISDLENDISSIKEEQRKKHVADQERKNQKAAAEAEEAAKIKAAADKRKREKKKQKKVDDKIKDLIKEAKDTEEGDDAFKGLLKQSGLGLLDEATGKLKIGTIIGGLLTAKDVPECTCPIIKALRDAIAARNRKEYATLSSYVDAYLIEWKKCANLPAISSVPVGSTELTNAIKDMTDEQAKKALEALNQAVRIQC